MRVTLFGSLRVSDGDRQLEIGGARLRTLLTRLALAPGELVHTGALVEALWAGDPPAGATNALQTLVSRLRRVVPADSVGSERLGYRLMIAPDQVDVVRFERLVVDGRRALEQGRREQGLRWLAEAERLWRGAPLLDVQDAPFARAAVVRLTELRLTAAEERLAALLRFAGPHELDEVIEEAERLAYDHPLRERLRILSMTALYRAGRHVEALRTYETFRARLAEELGADPSAEARDLHLTILRHESVPTQTPAAPGDGAFRTRLRRAQLTSFVGREREQAELRALRESEQAPPVRLLTIVGPGGAGKTRLAVQSSADDTGPVWLVELAALTGPQDVPNAVLAALGVRDMTLVGRADRQPGALDAVGRIERLLADEDGLLVLDNCEHVVTAVAELVDRLVAGCRRLRILATSREPLGVPGERLYPIPPLPADAAERLFADRARAVEPGFVLDDRNSSVVRRICTDLDGMPLAIELAAARVRTLPVDQIAARLHDRFRLLSGGGRSADPRHRTLRAVVEWSWDLLTEPERELARRMAVFAGGASLAAIERICGGGLDVLGQLVDRSLVEPIHHDGHERYRMLETVRAYAMEQLEKAGEATMIGNAHAAYFLRFAEDADDRLRTAEQLEWMASLHLEHDNVLAATRWAVGAEDAATAVRLVARMCWFWFLSGHRIEASVWLPRALAVPGEGPPAERGVASFYLALLSWGNGHVEQSGRLFATAREVAADPAVRSAFPMLALVSAIAPGYKDDRPGAIADTLAIIPELPPWYQGMGYVVLAHLAQSEGDLDLAATMTTEGHRVFERTGERWGRSATIRSLADQRVREGCPTEAIELYQEAAAYLEELGALTDQAHLIGQIGLVRARMGDLAGAERDLETSSRMVPHTDLEDGLVNWLGWAEFEVCRGNVEVARRLLEEALDGRVSRRPVAVPPPLRAAILPTAATVAILEDQPEKAATYLDEALEIALDERDFPALSLVVATRAALAVRTGRPRHAAREHALADLLRGGPDHSGVVPIPVEVEARAALGDQTYDHIAERALCTSRDDALAELRSGQDGREPTV